MRSATQHYDDAYLNWGRSISAMNAKVIHDVFAPYVRSTDRVVDFGCAGGEMLATLDCAERLGIEINPTARASAESLGVATVPSTAHLPDNWADVVISNSTLEHVEQPLTELRELHRLLRSGGWAIIRVPSETTAFVYRPGDINQHLYTWSRMTLGNLLTVAGFVVDDIRREREVYPPFGALIHRLFGRVVFHVAARTYRLLRLLLSPVWPLDIHTMLIGIARKP